MKWYVIESNHNVLTEAMAAGNGVIVRVIVELSNEGLEQSMVYVPNCYLVHPQDKQFAEILGRPNVS